MTAGDSNTARLSADHKRQKDQGLYVFVSVQTNFSSQK